MTNKETDSAYFFTVKPTLVKQLPPFHFKVMASSYTSKDEVLVFLYCPAIDHYALPGFFLLLFIQCHLLLFSNCPLQSIFKISVL